MSGPTIRSVAAFLLLAILGELENFAHSDVQWAIPVVIFFVAAPFIARWAGVGGYRALGLRLHKGWGWNLGLGLTCGLGLGVVQVLLAWRLGAFTLQAIHGGAILANLWAIAVVRTRSIWLAIGLHAGHNLGVNNLDPGNAQYMQVVTVDPAPWLAAHAPQLTACLMILVALGIARFSSRDQAADTTAEAGHAS